jgi:mannosylglycoprotein endo-beta-mannosidase
MQKRWIGVAMAAAVAPVAMAQTAAAPELGGWRMQDVAQVSAPAAEVSAAGFDASGWYKAAVPGTVLTTLVDNKVYPEPLYGEAMRTIPESLNKTSYWYRTTVAVPAAYRGRHVWLHFGGINYSAEVWVNGQDAGSMRGAFKRGDFDVSRLVTPGRSAVVAVLVAPEPHPGVPHEHTQANGLGKNGGETAIDGPTFLATIGWDWIPAIRDRDTGIWQPVTMEATGPVVVRNPSVTSDLSHGFDSADLHVSAEVRNLEDAPVSGVLTGTITGGGSVITFHQAETIPANARQMLAFDNATTAALHVAHPRLWWPNGFGEHPVYKLALRFETAGRTSDEVETQFGIRKLEYSAAGSDNLTIVVNGVKVMVRGGDWGMDEAMKRIPRDRLEAQFHMHALANLNMIRNWVGQSTSPDFYDLADKYGIMLWDEFFQPNPSDGPNPDDIPTYLDNVADKVLRYRNHPSIVLWCARNEGHPPKDLDDALSKLVAELDPGRLYQSSSTDGRGVSSHGPYFWRAPREFYKITEAFKTETGSVSVPTIESIQGMMPEKDWETINDDWAQHDLAKGAQHGDQYGPTLAQRYGSIRNLADFVRKAQLANYEAFRAMFEARNSDMFVRTTGVLTWMSHPAQPSFVWQLYHYDLEPNASMYAVQSAAEPVHVELNEVTRRIEIVNNRPEELRKLRVLTTVYRLDGSVVNRRTMEAPAVAASSTLKLDPLQAADDAGPVYFVELVLEDAGKTVSRNFYWQSSVQDDFTALDRMAPVKVIVHAAASTEGARTTLHVRVENPTAQVALMVHLQMHRASDGKRVLPVYYSGNYVSLAPGESSMVTIEAATQELAGPALLEVDGFNVSGVKSTGPVAARLNENAQPMHWPASGLVPASEASAH